MKNGSRGHNGLNAQACVVFVLTLLFGATLVGTTPALARHHYRYSPLVTGKDARLIVDGVSGKVLYSRNADAIRHPASLTKLMTLYLLFDALKHHRISMDTPLTFSRHAAHQHAMNMRASPGMRMTVRTAINAVVVRSANDVAVLIAEALGGTEGHFATMMNKKARELGMRHTFYHNASGLPDRRQVTTAKDLAILARRITFDFPEFFPFFAHDHFTYLGNHYHGHDNLLGRYPGADGMKTGFVNMSGFNLVSSVTRGRTHLIGVVMGGRTARARDKEMMRLLDVAFAHIREHPTMVAHATMPWRRAGIAMAAAEPARNHLWRIEGDGSITPVARPDGTARTHSVGDLIAQVMPAPSPVQTVSSELPTPAPRPAATPVMIGTESAVPHPRPAVTVPTDRAVQQVAMNTPAPRRTRPSAAVQPDVVSGETTAMHDWTIQIGAFDDLSQARARLSDYAKKSVDVLGQARRIIVPYQTSDGRWLYRARFGPFVERQARQICEALTKRGETCFAATATR